MESLPLQLERIDALEKLATEGPWINAYASHRCVKVHADGVGHPGPPECEYTFQSWITGEGWEGFVSSEPLRKEVAGANDYGPVLSPADARLIIALRSSWPSISSQVRALLEERDGLREALKGIAEHLHCCYSKNEPGQYGIGVTDGHRCAAEIARAALSRSGGENAGE